jgi:hypothetical protein
MIGVGVGVGVATDTSISARRAITVACRRYG